MNVFMIIILVLIFFIILHNSKYIKFNKIYRNMLKTIKVFVDDELTNNKIYNNKIIYHLLLMS